MGGGSGSVSGGFDDHAFAAGHLEDGAGVVFGPLAQAAGDGFDAGVDAVRRLPEEHPVVAPGGPSKSGETTNRSMSLQSRAHPVAYDPKRTANRTGRPLAASASR